MILLWTAQLEPRCAYVIERSASLEASVHMVQHRAQCAQDFVLSTSHSVAFSMGAVTYSTGGAPCSTSDVIEQKNCPFRPKKEAQKGGPFRVLRHARGPGQAGHPVNDLINKLWMLLIEIHYYLHISLIPLVY